VRAALAHPFFDFMTSFASARALAPGLLIVTLLGACGGGGGGSPPGGGGDGDNSWLSFSPSSVTVESYAGETRPINLVAVSTRTISEVLNVAIVDARGVVKPQVALRFGQQRYEADMEVSQTLSPGTYEGRFEVRLCRDNPATCAQPCPGSPWFVPYRVTVRPASNLTPLSALPGASAWSTYQGNAQHSGYVPANVSAAAFNRRWVVPANVGNMVVDEGHVVVAAPDNQFAALRSLAEDNGVELWRQAESVQFGGLAVGGGTVWSVGTGSGLQSFNPALLGIELTSGRTRVDMPLPSAGFSPRYAPVLQGGSVLFAADASTSLARHRISDGAVEWRVTLGTPFPLPVTRWGPAVSGTRAFVYDSQRLWTADLASGVAQAPISGPNYRPGISGSWEAWGAPVVGNGSLVYVTAYDTGMGLAYGAGSLVAFDVNAGTMPWSVSTTVRSNPVLAGAVLYVVEGAGSLQAYDANSGSALWRWDPPAPPSGGLVPPPPAERVGPDAPLLVVGNYAFLGSGGVTRAIDLNTRQAVWQYPLVGRLAVSANGVLYIGNTEKLAAFNLR
jgi:outer membrane protein assembly factor BamB